MDLPQPSRIESAPPARSGRWRDRQAHGSDELHLCLADSECQLDLVALYELERQLAAAPSATPVLVDLVGADPENGTLALLCALLRRWVADGMSLTVAHAQPRVRRVLELCEIDGLSLSA